MKNISIFDEKDIQKMLQSIGYYWNMDMIDMHDGSVKKITSADLSQIGFTFPVTTNAKTKQSKINVDFYITNFAFKQREFIFDKKTTICNEIADYSSAWQEMLIKEYGAEYKAKLVEYNEETIAYLNNQNTQNSIEVANLGQKWRALQDEIKENEMTISDLTKQNEQLQEEIEKSIEQ